MTSKQCFKCLATLPLDAFYPHPRMADGRLNKCKECAKRDAKNVDPIKRAAYERERGAKPERKRAIRTSVAAAQARDPERYRGYQLAYYDRNAEEIRAKQRDARAADPSRKAETNRRYDEANPEKRRAHRLVKAAKDAGTLIPKPCEGCATTKRVQAHHDDYSKPLDVRWLCAKCHKAEHRTALTRLNAP